MIVFDLDGCLSDDRFRRHHLTGQDFEAYHRLLENDLPMNEHVVDFACQQDVPIIIITARPEAYRAATNRWLRRWFPDLVAVDLYMRPLGENAPSPVLKARLLSAAMGPSSYNRKVWMAFDDREDVLRAYRDVCGVASAALHKLDDTGNVPLPRSPGGDRAAQILNEMAATMEERNKVYKDNWRQVPELVKVLWPDGVPSELVSLPQWHLFELILVKLTRFANADLQHPDSIHDTGVYSAIIESIIEEQSS